MIWFTSDLHLGHIASIKMNERPFKDVDRMNRVLIENINSRVSNRDTLYLLGDIAYRIPVEEANELISRINGKKILLKGNHDNKPYDENLFIGVYDYLRIKYNKVSISLMHYPMLSWQRSNYGSIQLHGHIHSHGEYNQDMLKQGIRRYDVGVDANNFYPISIDEVFKFMRVGG